MLLLCAMALALRLVGLTAQGLWRDEVDALLFAGRSWTELLSTFVAPGQNGPLYYVLLRLWTDVAGRGEFALRFFSLVWGVAAVPLGFVLARQLFRRDVRVAWLSAVLLAISPYLVWYGQEGKMYSLVVFLALLSTTSLLAAVEKGRWYRWLAYSVITAAGAYVHFLLALLILPHIMILLARGREGSRIRGRAWLAGAVAFVMLYLPLALWQVPLALQQAETGYRFVPLPDLMASLLQSYTLGVAAPNRWWAVLPFLAAALAGVLLWSKAQQDAGPRIQLAAWLIVPVLALFLLTLRRPMYTARYLIFVHPALLMLVAAGVVSVARFSRAAALAILVLILAVSAWGLWSQARTPLKADFRGATQALAERLGTSDLIIFQIPHGRYSFDYYYSPPALHPAGGDGAGTLAVYLPLVATSGAAGYRWADGLYTNGGMSVQEADQQMAAVVGGSRIVWLVESESWMWDERGLVRSWLEQHGKLTDRLDFVRVALYRYELW